MMKFGRRGVLAAGAALAVCTGARRPRRTIPTGHPVRRRLPAGRPGRPLGPHAGAAPGQILGQQVVVENKAGAAGNIGSQPVAEAKPDGYTLLIGPSIMSIMPSVYDKLPYDPLKSFDRRRLCRQRADDHRGAGRRREDLHELIALLKKEPGKHSYASPGQRRHDPHGLPAARSASAARRCTCLIAARRRA